MTLTEASIFGMKLLDTHALFQEWGYAYTELARSMGVTLVDAYTAFRGHGLSAPAGEGWLADWIHPNNRGHHEMRRLFLSAMALG
jgi:hypothetical protein